MSTQPVDSHDLWAGFAALDAQQEAAASWDDPIPLTARRELPAFPTEVFPAWLGDFVRGVAEETQTAVDAAGSLALAVLATAAGGRATVHVRGRWREPLNLFVVMALPPGSRKSAVFGLMTDPLYTCEKLMATKAAGAIIEAELTARLAKEVADNAATKAARADADKRDQLMAEAISLGQSRRSRHRAQQAPAAGRRRHPGSHLLTPCGTGRQALRHVGRGRDLRHHRRTLLRHPQHGALPQGPRRGPLAG